MALPKVQYPTFITKVPSTGEQVKFRPFTVKEEKILLTAMEGESQTEILNAIEEIISACFFNKLQPESLSTFDVEYLFLQIRMKSISEVVELEFRNRACPQNNNDPCEKTVKLSIKLDEVTLQSEKDGKYENFEPNVTKLGTKIMITDDLGVTIKYPGIRDIEAAEKIESEYNKSLHLVKSCITSVFDTETVSTKGEFTEQEITDFFESLLTADKQKLIDVVVNLPKLRIEKTFYCKTCGFEEPIVLEGLQSFFD